MFKTKYRTLQEAYDLMVAHMRKQQAFSMEEGSPRCKYRGPNGLMCAVGALIPDNVFHERMEAKTADELAILTAANMDPAHAWVMSDFQTTLHDNLSNFPFDSETFEAAAKVAAEANGLVYTPPVP